MSNWISPGRFGLSWRGALLRAAVPCLVFVVGFVALAEGAGVSERAIPAQPLHWIYYTLGLFVLGGLDLGTPNKGPVWAQVLLWTAFFSAPVVTASALLEALWLVALPVAYRLRRLRDHTVLVGSGRLSELYLQRMRALSPGARVILVERNPAHARLEVLAAKYPITVVIGDINNDSTLGILQLAHARRVVLLTGSDLTNLNAAYQILERAPMLAGRIVLHLGNLGLLQSVPLTRSVQASAFFNSHEIAARQLVSGHLLERLARTARADLVVMAGFGRFGQCVLRALQERAEDKFDEVLIVDVAAQARVSSFEDRVGFVGRYAHHVVSGNLLNCDIWAQLDRSYQLEQREPLIVLGAHDDMINLEAALWLRRRYPDAYIVVRQFNHSTFSAELARELNLLLFSAAELITQAIPADWCVKPRGLGP